MATELIPIQPETQVEDQDPVLSVIQRRGLIALLKHPNIRQAAQSIGVHERTLRRWLGQPDFQSALDAILTAGDDDLFDLLETGARTAVSALNDIAGDRYTEAARRVAASKHLLEYCERRTLRRDMLRLLRRP